MAELDVEKIKKCRRGEILGNVALAVCAAALIYFAVCFPVARAKGLADLELVALITAPIILAAGAATAAFCNLKYGSALSRAIGRYVVDVLVENAAALHPEKSSLSFYLTVDERQVTLQINDYKEKIVFDFSALGKLSAARKLAVLTETENRLCATFCRLCERGASYREVTYCEREGRRKKPARTVYIIKDGVPDRKIYKNYLKNI